MRRHAWHLLLGLFWVIVSFPAHSQNAVVNYIDKYGGLACELSFEFGIPASVILGVAIVESQAGTSRNCRLLNNHFGIKSGKKMKIPGTKHITAYKRYENDLQSYREFALYISRKSFYPDLVCNPDYKHWIFQISKAGYARAAREWRSKILKVINDYKLFELDD